jgi:hypothetical protein
MNLSGFCSAELIGQNALPLLRLLFQNGRRTVSEILPNSAEIPLIDSPPDMLKWLVRQNSRKGDAARRGRR